MALSTAIARAKDGLVELGDLPGDLSLKRRLYVLIYCTVLVRLCFAPTLGRFGFLSLDLRLFGR